MTNNAILRKIQALLNQNEKNGATKHEAQVALSKATKLMAEYDISEFDLQKVNKDSFVEKFIILKRMDITNLYTMLADAFDCEFYWKSRAKEGYFFGFELDVNLCIHFAKMLQELLLKEIKEYKKSYEYHCLIFHYQPRVVVGNFTRGFSENLIDKLSEIKKDKEKIVLSSGTALMVIKSQQVEAEFNKRHKCKEVSSKDMPFIKRAYLGGADRSDGIEFNNPLEAANCDSPLLIGKEQDNV